MNSLFLLIPIAILFVIIAIVVFFWALRNKQYDDLDREAYNILFDEASPKHQQQSTDELNKKPRNKSEK